MSDEKLYKEGSSVLDEVLKNLVVRKIRKEESVEAHWSEIIGPTLIRYTWFVRVDRRTLIVKVENTMDRMVVLQQKKRIIERWNRCFPNGTVLYLKVLIG